MPVGWGTIGKYVPVAIYEISVVIMDRSRAQVLILEQYDPVIVAAVCLFTS